MKAFLVGLVTIMAMAVFISLGALLLPLFVLLGAMLKIIIALVLVLVAVWALGKVVIYAWQKIRPEGKSR
ncbi:MAG: hypothetical protein V1727_06055 [Candidatus Omnitrophota bacterium]